MSWCHDYIILPQIWPSCLTPSPFTPSPFTHRLWCPCTMKDPLHIKVSVCLKGYEVSSMPQGMLEKVQWKGMNRCLCNYHKKVQDGMMTSCGPSPLPSSPASPSTVAYVTSLVAATCYLSLLPSAHTLASKSSFLMVVPSCHKENST